MLELWDHQKEVRELARDKFSFALFMEQGTGKSGALISILRDIYSKHNRLLPTLILAPKIVLKQWRREFARFSIIDKNVVFALSGSSSQCLKIMNKAMEQKDAGLIFIINYEKLLSKDIYANLLAFNPKVLVCDESHLLKSPTSKRSILAEVLADRAKYKFLLTGTPILNSALDIYQQYKILDGGETFGKNFFAFRGKYFEDDNAGWSGSSKHFPVWVPRASTYKRFNELIYEKAMRVLKKDCLDLPPLVRQTVEVELNADQKRMYKEMKRDLITFIDKKHDEPAAVVAKLAVTKAIRLQQIVCGHVKDDSGQVTLIPNNPRIKVLKEVIAPLLKDHKIIIWAAFRADYEAITNMLAELKVEYVQIHGGIPQKEREVALERFEKDELCRAMVANQSAAGTGVNLTAASYSVYFSKSFKLGDDIQSEARNHRGGSEIHEKITRIDLVTPGTIDEAVTKALANKQDISDRILTIKEMI